MKEKYVFDAGPLSLLFAGRKEVKKYFEEMYRGNAIIYMSEVNLAEFLYIYISKKGKDIGIARHRYIRNSPIKIISPNERITESVALLKSKYSYLSLADAFLIATAKEVKGKAITTDEDIEKTKEVETITIPLD
ncbi:MAG: type II toxin-antitoxin system VapC family toxin [Saccharolobus sp.]|uniref:type II toxin-antitoxin system VapC family toxin n=1 Tax=Saccharolobus TaxID=2100760 RepID=UPI001F1022EC|nr:type II toxin-antitoxin system VapC family toxin [Saccharolobus shibatae]MCH4816799.1 type II toxin-antitoxin system VapC family toxin [Saccharolobus shibatae]